MNDAANNFEFLAAQMADPHTSWSLGTFGAIAEFVRDAETLEMLTRFGVDFGQGMHIGEPRPVEEVLQPEVEPARTTTATG